MAARGKEHAVEPTGKDLVAFFDFAADKGLMARDWASTLKSAAKVMLSTVESENWESLDIETLDLDAFVLRFERLRMGDLKPDSLNVYGKRLRNAVTAYRDYLKNPSTWQYAGRTEGSARAPRRATKVARAESAGSVQPISAGNGSQAGLIQYPYPLRPNMIVSISLPPDLTQKEATRLSAYLHSLAVDEQLALPIASEQGETELNHAGPQL
jgi:hypothetical protein